MCVEGAGRSCYVIGVCGGGKKKVLEGARRSCYRCVWRGQEEGVIGVCGGGRCVWRGQEEGVIGVCGGGKKKVL